MKKTFKVLMLNYEFPPIGGGAGNANLALLKEYALLTDLNFKRGDDIFNLLIEKSPEDPYLLLYKGMNLTHLNKGKESVIYLNEALRIEPDIFRKRRFLGVISFWKHIEPEYAKEWELAFKKHGAKD